MNITQLSFDENMEMKLFVEELGCDVRLVLSDGLYAYEEKLTPEYKEEIAAFINGVSVWYNKAVQAVLARGKQLYNTTATKHALKLQSIFILFEQNEAPLFGLSFRTEFDIEHGCGVKISGGSFDITEVRTAEVAFC